MELLQTIKFLNLDDGDIIAFNSNLYATMYTAAELKKYFSSSNIFVKEVIITTDWHDDSISFYFRVSKDDEEKLREFKVSDYNV